MQDRTHNQDPYLRQAGPYADFVREMVESGRYESAGEVILAGLALLRDEEIARNAKREWLKREVAKGVEQADAGELIPAEDVFSRLREAIRAEASAPVE